MSSMAGEAPQEVAALLTEEAPQEEVVFPAEAALQEEAELMAEEAPSEEEALQEEVASQEVVVSQEAAASMESSMEVASPAVASPAVEEEVRFILIIIAALTVQIIGKSTCLVVIKSFSSTLMSLCSNMRATDESVTRTLSVFRKERLANEGSFVMIIRYASCV